jgi:hypothetical protein
MQARKRALPLLSNSKSYFPQIMQGFVHPLYLVVVVVSCASLNNSASCTLLGALANMENSKSCAVGTFNRAKQQAIRELLTNLDPCRPRSGACWIWPRWKSEEGYGCIFFDGYKFPVHRLSFEHYKGRIPYGQEIMHQCDNPSCFNPDHLFLGTHQENMQDMARKGRGRKRAS